MTTLTVHSHGLLDGHSTHTVHVLWDMVSGGDNTHERQCVKLPPSVVPLLSCTGWECGPTPCPVSLPPTRLPPHQTHQVTS